MSRTVNHEPGFKVKLLTRPPLATRHLHPYSTGAPEQREALGLQLIGYAFLALAVYITAQAAYTLIGGHHPGHSTLGIAWTAATCTVMLALARGKTTTGTALGNPVLQAEGRVTF